MHRRQINIAQFEQLYCFKHTDLYLLKIELRGAFLLTFKKSRSSKEYINIFFLLYFLFLPYH